MPSKSRRHKPPQKKRQEITAPDGWTHVINGPKRLPTDRPNDLSSRLASLTISHPLGADEVHLQLQRYRKSFLASSFQKRLESIIQASIPSSLFARLTGCVCLGLGSFTDGRETSKHQLVTLMWMLDALAPHHAICDVVFQDPAFNDSDKAYLESRGHTVVETPKAFEIIGPQTFLFAPHLERGVYAEALGNALPGLSVGSEVKLFIDQLVVRPTLSQNDAQAGGWTRKLKVFERFQEAMVSVPMPEHDRDTWCNSTTIYWLKDGSRSKPSGPKEEEEEEEEEERTWKTRDSVLENGLL